MSNITPAVDSDKRSPAPEPETAKKVRELFWRSGYRPVPLYNPSAPVTSPGKQPKGDAWQTAARQDPPAAVINDAEPDAYNTGILADGLRVIDVDVDDAEIARKIRDIAVEHLGHAPERYRKNSGRVALLYRAAEGEPGKRWIQGPKDPSGNRDKVEILGRGQQFLAHGWHPSGASIEWKNIAPRDALSAITEEQISAFLTVAAPLIGASPTEKSASAVDPSTIDQASLVAADPDALAEIVAQMPNAGAFDDRNAWIAFARALKASFADQWRARTLFLEHAERWKGGTPRDGEAERVWDSVHAPHAVGADWIIEHARDAGIDTSAYSNVVAAKRWDEVCGQFDFEPRPANQAGKQGRPKARLLSIDDIEALPDPRWLINGLLPEQGLAIAFGPPKHGKTFVALSMALHVAAGIDWCGHKVQPGGVVYIAGEGAGGLKLRVAAARKQYDIPADIPFWVLPRAVNFGQRAEVEELAAMIHEAAGGTEVRLVVVDTLARAMPGLDENSAGEIGRVIAACDWLKDELGATVLPIHHQGKDGDRGMRGSSALDGAVDTLLHIARQREGDSDVVTLTSRYQKDAEEGAPMHFDLQRVEAIGGRQSLVPVLRDGDAPKADKLTPQQKAALNVLEELISERQTATVDESEWRKICVDGRRVSGSENPKTRREAFNTALAALTRAGRVRAEHGKIWLPANAEEFLPVKAGGADDLSSLVA